MTKKQKNPELERLVRFSLKKRKKELRDSGWRGEIKYELELERRNISESYHHDWLTAPGYSNEEILVGLRRIREYAESHVNWDFRWRGSGSEGIYYVFSEKRILTNNGTTEGLNAGETDFCLLVSYDSQKSSLGSWMDFRLPEQKPVEPLVKKIEKISGLKLVRRIIDERWKK